MEYELYHHGILGQKWGQRNGPPYPLSGSDHSAAEKRAARYRSGAERAEEKIAKNKAKIEKLNNYRNSKRNQKLEIKRNKLAIKRARLDKRVNSARMKRDVYEVGPNRRERRALKKAYKLDTKIARVERKQNIWQQKVNKLEYKNTKLEHKVQTLFAKADKLDSDRVKQLEASGKRWATTKITSDMSPHERYAVSEFNKEIKDAERVYKSKNTGYQKRALDLITKINSNNDFDISRLSKADQNALQKYADKVNEYGTDFDVYSDKEIREMRKADDKLIKKRGYGFDW